MALWVVRTGKHGEHEQRFLEDKRVYLTWEGFDRDLKRFDDKPALVKAIQEVYPDAPLGRARNYAAQMWTFAHRMKAGDWVIVPSKQKAAIHVAEMTGGYKFDEKAADPYFHWREVKWVERDLARSRFDQDLLYSFGAIQTIFGVSRNDAERRVRAMAKAGWKVRDDTGSAEDEETLQGPDDVDLEIAARDQLAKLIIQKYKGHGLELLVEAILKAQGYTTYHSPTGADKGVDLLAAPGPLGFGEPRICVQVKSTDGAVDTPTLRDLLGTMQNVNAQQGLLVSWGGFKTSVDKERAGQFFRVRLWDQKDLIEQFLAHYDAIDSEIRADLPLKRVWVVARGDSD